MKKSFLYKMILADCIYVVIMTAAIMFLWLYTSISSDIQATQSYLTTFADKTASQFEDIVKDMEQLSYSIATSDAVQASLKTANETAGNANYYNFHQTERRNLTRLLQLLSGINGSRNITLVSNAGDYVRLGIFTTIDLSRDDMLAHSYLHDPDYSQWQKRFSPPSPDHYGSINEATFSFSRKVASSYGTYGYVELQDTTKTLDRILDNPSGSQYVSTFITYQDEYFYSTQDQKELWAELAINLSDQNQDKTTTEGPVKISLGEKSFYMQSIHLKNYSMALHFLVPADLWNEGMTKQVLLILLIGITIGIVLCTITIAVNNHLYKPVRTLSNQMKAFSIHENIIDLPQIEGNDEITLFHQAFQTMMQNIHQQNDELISRRLREIQLSYQALQTQVSPHFLYNTLSVIGLKGEMADCPEIMDMCSYLTRMMSYTMHSQNLTVSFNEEIEYMQYYLYLMQYRYMDKLQYTLHIDEKVRSSEVPKFVLQPIVENCFTHGFKTLLIDTYLINVSVSSQENGWTISVEDNGKGFSDEDITKVYAEMRKVYETIKAPDINSDFVYDMQSIGLIGTYARLVLTMKGRIDLQIQNRQNGGCCVIIRFIRE